MSDDRIEELRATLLEFEDDEILEALILNNIVDRESGLLTEWWLSLLDPGLLKGKPENNFQEEDIVLNALAKLIKRRIP